MKSLVSSFAFVIILFYSNILKALPDSFADLVEKSSPSVVSIAASTIIKNTNQQEQIPRFPERSPLDD